MSAVPTRIAGIAIPTVRWRVRRPSSSATLHGPGCAVVVAAANPAVCLNRVIPARWNLTLKPTRDDALIHLLASPV
jgi:hypothetical protein